MLRCYTVGLEGRDSRNSCCMRLSVEEQCKPFHSMDSCSLPGNKGERERARGIINISGSAGRLEDVYHLERNEV